MPDPIPQDVYQIVADAATKVLREQALRFRLTEDPDELAIKWLTFFGDGGIPRGAAKRICMTRPYGSTRHSSVDFFLEWFIKHRDEYPNNPFEGDAFNSCRFIAGIIYDSVSEVCSSAEECMRYLQSMSDVFVENEARMIWTTPTGFPVIHAYKESKSSTIKTMLNERVRKVSFRERSSGYSKVASKNAISANYVHSLDAACLHLIVNKLKERGVMNVRTIHDSFGVTPCEVDILDQTIREVFVEVFSDDLLLKFHREAQALLPRVELPELPERGDPSMVPELLKSDYFFA